jgi:hypothetical protein
MVFLMFCTGDTVTLTVSHSCFFFFWAGLLRKALFGYRLNLGEMRKEMGIGEIGNVSSRAFVFCDFARESLFQFFFLV